MTTSQFEFPKISIITPSYNSGQFIEDTIRSVLDQNYPDLEYLVIDGGSTDQTLDILKKYEGSLTWVSEKDHGQSHAINKGLLLATGDVIAYLNSDDTYEPGALMNVAKFIIKHPQAFWVTGKCRFIDPNGHEIRRLVTRYKNFWLLWCSYSALMVLDYVSQPATFWCKEVIDEVGYFNEDLHYTMDYDYSLRAGNIFKLWHIKQNLASYRIHNNSKTFSSTASINAQFDEDLAIAKKHGASQLLIYLHILHNALITKIYRGMVRASV
jgi:glycosyltransferase involved in cell wall biosynthesis